MLYSPLFQDFQDEGGGLISACFTLVYCVLIILVVIGLWKVYEKANKPGWAAIIPFYNIWVLLEIVGRPGWWIILMFIPLVNFIVGIIVTLDLAKSFGKDVLYAIGLLLLPMIFYLHLGWSDAQYRGPTTAL